MKFIKLLFFLIVFLCGIVFFIQNSVFITEKIGLHFNLFGTKWETQPIPLYVYFLSSFAIGALVSFLYLIGEKLKLSSEVSSLKKRISQLEQELASVMPEQEQEEEEVEQ